MIILYKLNGGIIIKPQNFFKRNKKYFKFVLSLLTVTILSTIFYNSSKNFEIGKFLKEIKVILAPFIYGIIIAYILNYFLKLIEKNIFEKINFFKNKKTIKRSLSIASTYILLFGIIGLLISYIIPEIASNIQNVILYFKDFDVNTITKLLDKVPESSQILSEINLFINKFLIGIINKIKYLPNIISTIISSTVGIASSIFNIALGFVISVHILFDKENIANFFKKMIYSFVKEENANSLIEFLKTSNKTFENFFAGKLIDSTIIGIIFFAGAYVISVPYAFLLSFIIGITNMIPYFGPFIGGIPVVIITFLSSISTPSKALWIAIFIIALQQFDGIILGPKILGNSIGLKPLGIIFSIMIGGAIWGAPGMFFGVPIFAIILSLCTNYIDKLYKNKYKIEYEKNIKHK